MHEDDAVADLLDVAHVVAGVEDGDAAFALDAAEDAADLVGDVGVETGGGLIEHEEPGVIEEGLAEMEAGGFACGELGGDAVSEVSDLEHFEEFGDACLEVSDAVETAEDGEVLPDEEIAGEACVGGGEVAAAEDGFAVGERVHAEDPDGAGCWGHEAEDDVHGGGFACAIGTEQTDDFAGIDVEGEVVDGDGAVVERAAEAADEESWRGGSLRGGEKCGGHAVRSQRDSGWLWG